MAALATAAVAAAALYGRRLRRGACEAVALLRFGLFIAHSIDLPVVDLHLKAIS